MPNFVFVRHNGTTGGAFESWYGYSNHAGIEPSRKACDGLPVQLKDSQDRIPPARKNGIFVNCESRESQFPETRLQDLANTTRPSYTDSALSGCIEDGAVFKGRIEVGMVRPKAVAKPTRRPGSGRRGRCLNRGAFGKRTFQDLASGHLLNFPRRSDRWVQHTLWRGCHETDFHCGVVISPDDVLPALADGTIKEADYPVEYEVENTSKTAKLVIEKRCSMTLRDRANTNVDFT